MTTDYHPSRRVLGMMTYNSRIDRVCFYGGLDGVTTFEDTWYYDYNENLWTNMNESIVPGPRYSHTLDYDSESDVVVLFGGRDWYNPTGDLNDETWFYHSPINTPSPPSNFTAELLPENTIQLNWNPPSGTPNPRISNYTIYRGMESGVLNILHETVETSYLDDKVEEGQAYFYTICAKNSLGIGDMTPEISIIVPQNTSSPTITTIKTTT